MVLRLEDLSEDKISNILSFLKLGKSFDKSKVSVHNVGRKNKIEWIEERSNFFWNMNADLMKKFGYKK